MDQAGQDIRSFNRFELKYVVTLQQAEDMKRALRSYLVPDRHGCGRGRYSLASLYYESPDLRCYREKMDGLRYRRKLRLRLYGREIFMTDQTPVFLEVKQRVDRVTQKRRALLPYGEALHLCNDRDMPRHEACDRPLVEEVFVLLWQYNLQPATIVLYDRQAWVGTRHEPGLRVTFDSSLSVQAHPLHLHDLRSGIPMMPADRVVMEVKANDRIPVWLTEMIAAHNLQLHRISKYCRSVDIAGGPSHGDWRGPRPESSREVLASSVSIFHPLPQAAATR